MNSRELSIAPRYCRNNDCTCVPSNNGKVSKMASRNPFLKFCGIFRFQYGKLMFLFKKGLLPTAFNDLLLDVEYLDLWKFVDDTTMAESVDKSEPSKIQAFVDELASKSQIDRFQLNEAKCKELRISFAKTKRDFEPITINSKSIDVVPHAKLLGLNISCDLKWNVHISETVREVSSRLYCLRQLKRAKIATKELITFYTTCIRHVSECASQVYYNSLRSSEKATKSSVAHYSSCENIRQARSYL